VVRHVIVQQPLLGEDSVDEQGAHTAFGVDNQLRGITQEDIFKLILRIKGFVHAAIMGGPRTVYRDIRVNVNSTSN
jgi:hypothetical protein